MYIVVLVTTKNVTEADKIAAGLIKARLIACANILQGVRSVFRWQGKVDKAAESLMIIKSRKKCLPKIIKLVKKLHSYDTPEIIALPVVGGSEDYLDWVKNNCTA